MGRRQGEHGRGEAANLARRWFGWSYVRGFINERRKKIKGAAVRFHEKKHFLLRGLPSVFKKRSTFSC